MTKVPVLCPASGMSGSPLQGRDPELRRGAVSSALKRVRQTPHVEKIGNNYIYAGGKLVLSFETPCCQYVKQVGKLLPGTKPPPDTRAPAPRVWQFALTLASLR